MNVERRSGRCEALIRLAVAIALAVGIAFVGLAIVYWALPPEALPAWLPGHKLHSNPRHGHHYKRHGLTAFVLGVALLSSVGVALRTDRRRPNGPP